MKKVVLLFTILCAGQLYSMEPEKGAGMKDLPREVQSLIIIMTSQSGNSLKDVIQNIAKMSEVNTTFYKIVNDIYDNQKTFATLVQVLAKKFNMDPYSVAVHFKTPTSAEYLRLATALLEATKTNDHKKVTELLNAGADVNYYTAIAKNITPLTYAIHYGDANMVKELLEFGANPNHTGIFSSEPVAIFLLENVYASEKKEKRQLIEGAMKK